MPNKQSTELIYEHTNDRISDAILETLLEKARLGA